MDLDIIQPKNINEFPTCSNCGRSHKTSNCPDRKFDVLTSPGSFFQKDFERCTSCGGKHSSFNCPSFLLSEKVIKTAQALPIKGLDSSEVYSLSSAYESLRRMVEKHYQGSPKAMPEDVGTALTGIEALVGEVLGEASDRLLNTGSRGEYSFIDKPKQISEYPLKGKDPCRVITDSIMPTASELYQSIKNALTRHYASKGQEMPEDVTRQLAALRDTVGLVKDPFAGLKTDYLKEMKNK